jgi:hypothetical protein
MDLLLFFMAGKIIIISYGPFRKVMLPTDKNGRLGKKIILSQKNLKMI